MDGLYGYFNSSAFQFVLSPIVERPLASFKTAYVSNKDGAITQAISDDSTIAQGGYPKGIR